VIDGRTPLDLPTVHFFEEEFFEELIDERCVDARDALRPQAPTILQDVFANHLDACFVNTALPRA